jgi:hypothetical protein
MDRREQDTRRREEQARARDRERQLQAQKMLEEKRKLKKLQNEKLQKHRQQKQKLLREAKLKAKQEGRRTGLNALLFGAKIKTPEERIATRKKSFFRWFAGRGATADDQQAVADARARKEAAQAAAYRRLEGYAQEVEAHERGRGGGAAANRGQDDLSRGAADAETRRLPD